MKHQQLMEQLKQLRLFEIANSYAEIATIAEKKSLTYEQFLADLVQAESEIRKHRRIQRYIKDSKIKTLKNLDSYDYSKRKGINALMMSKLATGDFLGNGSNIVFYGTFGVGKSHLAKGLLIKLCENGYRCRFYNTHELINDLLTAQRDLKIARLYKQLDRYDVIVCDELGYTPHDKEGANLFFQFISNRYERKSLIFTTNLTYSEWDKVFLDSTMTAAAVDRIVHRCQSFNVQGPSWRGLEAAKNSKIQNE